MKIFNLNQFVLFIVNVIDSNSHDLKVTVMTFYLKETINSLLFEIILIMFCIIKIREFLNFKQRKIVGPFSLKNKRILENLLSWYYYCCLVVVFGYVNMKKQNCVGKCYCVSAVIFTILHIVFLKLENCK